MKISNKSLAKKIEDYLKEEPNEALRSEIAALIKMPEKINELDERMGITLCFGTAGLRGKMEAGYNRMNSVTVYRFAHALASEILKRNNNKKVVIGFDARNNSQIFAQEMADILERFSIQCFIADRQIPTPLCAFATKYLDADFGVMITASHNPGFDNGVKVFSKNSAQLEGAILRDIEKGMIEAPLRDDFFSTNLVVKESLTIPKQAFDNYFAAMHTTQFFSSDEKDLDVAIVYTPLHGVGKDFFLRALREENFSTIEIVEEQSEPDGAFPTLSFPNPEEEHTLDLAHKKAELLGLTWVFANDPDADRLQVSCRTEEGNFRKLSGNEMGTLLGFFAIEKAKKDGIVPIVGSSIVSSRMLSVMAKDLAAIYVDALTGFSNIAQAALSAEAKTNGQLVFAYEEAIGFLVGKIVLDKDGISAAARFMEIAAYLRKQNLTVWEFLDRLYLRFGLFANYQWSIRFDGIAAQQRMLSVMEKIRTLSMHDVLPGYDHASWDIYDLNSPHQGPYEALKANVIIFEIKEKARFIVRPSGTEPKIKFYLELIDDVDESTLKNKKEFLNGALLDFRSKIEAKVF